MRFQHEYHLNCVTWLRYGKWIRNSFLSPSSLYFLVPNRRGGYRINQRVGIAIKLMSGGVEIVAFLCALKNVPRRFYIVKLTSAL